MNYARKTDIWAVVLTAFSWQSTHLLQGTLFTITFFHNDKKLRQSSGCREYIRDRQVLINCIYIISKPSSWNESPCSWHFFNSEVYLTEMVHEVDDYGGDIDPERDQIDI